MPNILPSDLWVVLVLFLGFPPAFNFRILRICLMSGLNNYFQGTPFEPAHLIFLRLAYRKYPTILATSFVKESLSSEFVRPPIALIGPRPSLVRFSALSFGPLLCNSLSLPNRWAAKFTLPFLRFGQV